jgi:hypothetical protein
MLLAQAWTWLCDHSKCENGFNDASQFVMDNKTNEFSWWKWLKIQYFCHFRFLN